MVNKYLSPILLGTMFWLSSSTASASDVAKNLAPNTVSTTSNSLYADYQRANGRLAHQQLYQRLLSFRLKSADDSVSDLKNATQLWLDWYAIRQWALPELAAPAIDKAEALAHRDPVAALKLLEKAAPTNQPEQLALNLLLQGFISNHLDSLWLSERRPAQSSTAQDFVQQHPNDYQTGELCYGVHYLGTAWQQVEKKFAGQTLAEAAAYLKMQQQSCGECEGVFSCYLAREIDPALNFLAKYPRSALAEHILQRSLLRIQQHFVVHSASTDFLSNSADYQAQEVASVLVEFESKLAALPQPLQLRLKLGLLPFYLGLNQTSNSQRILDWLKNAAPADSYQDALNLQARFPKLALYMQTPKIWSPTLIQLNWSWRKNFTPQELKIWRASRADFADAQLISDTIPVQQSSFYDSKVQPGQAYWYQLRSAASESTVLSHRAYQEIDPIDAALRQGVIQSWILDQQSQQLYFQTPLRLAEYQIAKVWQTLPLKTSVSPTSKLAYVMETPQQALFLDYTNQNVHIGASSPAVRLQDLQLPTSAKKSSSTVFLPNSNQALRLNNDSVLLNPNQQAFYFWLNASGLWRSDLQAKAIQQVFSEKAQASQQFEALKLFALDKEGILIAGNWKNATQSLLGWRIWRQAKLSDVVTPYAPHYASPEQAFATDTLRQGVWLISKAQTTAQLLNWQGQLLRTLSEKDFPVRLKGRIERVLSNPQRQEIYFASSYQVFRLSAANTIELLWQQDSSSNTEQVSGQIVRAIWQPVEKQLQLQECQLQARWFGLDPGLCQQVAQSGN